MSQAHLFAIGILLAWMAGIRVYLTVFGLGLAGVMGWLDLPPALDVATSPWVLGVSGLLATVEFFADKIPGVDSGWDFLHTLLRVPVGAFLAAATLSPNGDLGAGMLATGAGVALSSHLLKAGTRALLNTSPEPVSNWTASVTEDVAVVGGLALAFAHPFLALAIVVAVSALLAMAVWWVWRRVRRALFAPRPPAPATELRH
ncbi:membrane protein [Lysobacter helvus]|uniref:Membrane protein n=2 Tax=Lysobacteraceae TaxID=32033 RepID=A0ABM7Q5H6_9GAMM|nr:membrane protein [Lysobacter caseinilyticus]BCT95758.1 membrane protein [Lysobacter helvus]